LTTPPKREIGIGILRGNLFWLVVCQCIWGFTTNIPTSYLPLYIKTLGGTAADVGYVRSIAILAGLFLFPLGGYIADKAGRVKLVNWMTFGYAFSMIPYFLATTWQMIAVAAFFQSLVMFYTPILTVLMADAMPVGQRAAGFGLAISIPQAIAIFAPSVGGIIVDAMGLVPAMRTIYQIGFVAGVFVAFLRRATLKESIDVSKMEKLDWSNFPKLWVDSFRSFFETVRWLPPFLKALAVMAMIQIFFNNLSGSMWIVYATGVIGISATQWGLNSGVQGLTSLIFAFNAGKLMDKYGRRRFLVPVLFLVPILPILFITLSSWMGLVLMVIMMAIMNAFLVSGFQSLVSDWCPRERRGRVTSAIGTGSFFLDIRNTGSGGGSGGMLSVIPAALGQALGGTLYMVNPILPFILTASGMVIVAIYGYLRVMDPKIIEK
jgi:MFS family permease